MVGNGWHTAMQLIRLRPAEWDMRDPQISIPSSRFIKKSQ